MALGTLVAFAAATGAQELDREAEYRQNTAVLARYPDMPIALDTPALKPGRADFTSQAEMEAYLASLKARVPGVVLGSLGRSTQGRNIPYLVFTKEGLTDAAAIAALGRPILWFIGLQHGNEPAGGEAMLALAAHLADGPLQAYLDRVTVVVVPRANRTAPLPSPAQPAAAPISTAITCCSACQKASRSTPSSWSCRPMW